MCIRDRHGIGNVADSRLQRQEMGGKTRPGHFMPKEFEQIARNAQCRIVGRFERQVPVRTFGFADRDDFFRVTAKAGLPDPVVGANERERDAIGRQRSTVTVSYTPLDP